VKRCVEELVRLVVLFLVGLARFFVVVEFLQFFAQAVAGQQFC
jgi:hypothetical protein